MALGKQFDYQKPYPGVSQTAGPGWELDTPPADYRPPTKRFSEEAAAAAQRYLDLEDGFNKTSAEAGQLRNLLHLAEERNKQLTADLKSIELDRDYYKDRCTTIMTKLTVAGTIILNAMAEPPERVDPEKIAAINEAAAAIVSLPELKDLPE